MGILGATLGSVTGLSFLSQFLDSQSSLSYFSCSSVPCSIKLSSSPYRNTYIRDVKSISVNANAETDHSSDQASLEDVPVDFTVDIRQARRSADWKAARAYYGSGFIYRGRVEGFNGGGLLVRFYSLVGFLPFPQLSPSHSCREPQRSIHDIAKDLVGSLIPVKVVHAAEEARKLILSEKGAMWSKYSGTVSTGDVFTGRVGSVEDYGAFIHLRFYDGLYHLTGLVHVSEVSWDFVQDVRDVLREGEEVRVKVINVDQEKSRITLSIKQLEDDPLLETLDKVISQDDSVGFHSLRSNDEDTIEALPGLELILKELLQENDIEDVRINRQGFEKRVVSQDLQLWLSNTPPSQGKFVLLARAGRQVQEIHLTTTLDQKGIKAALQRVLERVP